MPLLPGAFSIASAVGSLKASKTRRARSALRLVQLRQRLSESLHAKILRRLRALQPIQERRDIDEPRPRIDEVKIKQLATIPYR